MKKFYRIFVVSEIALDTEYGEYGSYVQYSEGETITPYDGKLFESEEEAEKYLEKVETTHLGIERIIFCYCE